MNAEIPYEKQAMQGDCAPDGLDGIGLLTYYAACYMYGLYHAGQITRENGTKMKRTIVQALEEATKAQNKYSFLWDRLESSSRAYTLNKTIENADKFHNAVYNMNGE